jgi:hypothetical protein
LALAGECGYQEEVIYANMSPGSPNVQGFAYFLIQHKEQLGNMFIEKIQVFQGETKAELPCILVHVKQQAAPSADVHVEQRDKNNILRVHKLRANL